MLSACELCEPQILNVKNGDVTLIYISGWYDSLYYGTLLFMFLPWVYLIYIEIQRVNIFICAWWVINCPCNVLESSLQSICKLQILRGKNLDILMILLRVKYYRIAILLHCTHSWWFTWVTKWLLKLRLNVHNQWFMRFDGKHINIFLPAASISIYQSLNFWIVPSIPSPWVGK